MSDGPTKYMCICCLLRQFDLPIKVQAKFFDTNIILGGKAFISLGTHSVAIISILPDSFTMVPSRLKLSSSLFVALMNDGYHMASI